MIKIDQEIKEWRIHNEVKEAPVKNEPVVVHVKEKSVERPEVLDGKTYKLKPGNSDHAFYVTITNHNGKPYELFISTKGSEHYQWIMALTRMISAVMRNAPDASFIIEELCAVSDPAGGFFSPTEQRYVPSIVCAIGLIIKKHYASLSGAIEDTSLKDASAKMIASKVEKGKMLGNVCPKCHDNTLVLMDGCWTCASCGYSKCG